MTDTSVDERCSPALVQNIHASDAFSQLLGLLGLKRIDTARPFRVTAESYVRPMSSKPIFIAGEPLDLLLQTIPSLTTKHCGGTRWRVSFPADNEQGAAWGRAIERYAADLLTAKGHIPIDQ